MKKLFFLMLLPFTALPFIPHARGRAEHLLTPARQPAQEDKGKQDKGERDGKVSGDLGAKTNPVRCKGPRGERAYLNRLRCGDGKPPEYRRMGSYGKGPYGNILDGYSVSCEGKDAVTVFMDMYHEHVEEKAVPGFTIVDSEKPAVAAARPTGR